MDIQTTPTSIVHLLSQVIHSIESANLHVLDGLNEGDDNHHFEAAAREVERATRGLQGAIDQTKQYSAQIKQKRNGITCNVCNNAAKWKEADGNSYYCSVECSKK